MEILHSRIIGEGQPIVILHGFLGMSDNWKSTGSRYAENGFQVHLVDQRNHGQSFWSEEFNYGLMAEDLLAYADHHKLDTFILMGHSMGGKTAMKFAVKFPDRVEKLLVADIAPKYYPPHHQEIINALLNVSAQTLRSRTQADEILASSLSDMGIRQFLLKNLYWVHKEELGFRFNLAVLQHRMEAVGEGLQPGETFEKATLFLKGAQSDYILEEDLELIHHHFPMARLVSIERAGHWLHAENPGEFVRETLKFLNS